MVYTHSVHIQTAPVRSGPCCDLSDGKEDDFRSAKVDKVDYEGGEHSGCYVSVIQCKFQGASLPGQKAYMWYSRFDWSLGIPLGPQCWLQAALCQRVCQ